MTKYIGVSKLRLMAGKSKFCCVCGVKLHRPPDSNHKCVEHAEWVLHVTDSSTRPDPDHRINERWED